MINSVRRSFLSPKVSLFFILVILTCSSTNLNWTGDNWQGILEADARGYYAYLPAVFIYNDLNFDFFEAIEQKKYYNEHFYYDYRYQINGQSINRYFCGTAVLQSPFFLVAHILSKTFGYEADGYSRLYPVLMNVAALFYAVFGLFFLMLLFKSYQLQSREIALTLWAAVFGTNLFYYTVVEPGMSHVYSFALITMFAYNARMHFMAPQKKYLLVLAALLGLIVLTRPINGLIIFIIPLLAASFERLQAGIVFCFRRYVVLLSGIAIFFAIVFIQLSIYKLSIGSFFVYSYGNHQLNFWEPHFMDILFSYRKGLFLYTPIYLLSVFGLYFLRQSSVFSFWSWIFFFVLITYVLSSWEQWYYGGSFSSRVYVDFLCVFLLLLCMIFKGLKDRISGKLFLVVVLMLVGLCQFQTYQYRYFYIHWSEMNKEKYWDVFLNFDKTEEIWN